MLDRKIGESLKFFILDFLNRQFGFLKTTVFINRHFIKFCIIKINKNCKSCNCARYVLVCITQRVPLRYSIRRLWVANAQIFRRLFICKGYFMVETAFAPKIEPCGALICWKFKNVTHHVVVKTRFGSKMKLNILLYNPKSSLVVLHQTTLRD